jgi:hypothetical protein
MPSILQMEKLRFRSGRTRFQSTNSYEAYPGHINSNTAPCFSPQHSQTTPPFLFSLSPSQHHIIHPTVVMAVLLFAVFHPLNYQLDEGKEVSLLGSLDLSFTVLLSLNARYFTRLC